MRLTPLQYALLSYLAHLSPLAVGRYSDIAAAMRPYDYLPMTPALIRWHAGILRSLVASTAYFDPPGPCVVPWPPGVLRTEWGVGLRLDWTLGLVAPRQTQLKSKRKSII